MQAQEAIERMERKLTADKERLEFYKSNERNVGYEKFEEEIEALSIVLLSARVLHEILEEPRKIRLGPEKLNKFEYRIKINGGLNHEIVGNKEELKKIGIEEGAGNERNRI